jgi:sulfopyruvate decarboxylase subunit beta
MQRSDIISNVAELTTPQDLLVCYRSIGEHWDDWFDHRPGRRTNTFSPVILGSVTPTALGLALALPHRRVLALDTDGSMLMNTGAMCTLGNQRPPNLTVIVFDNAMYEGTGSQPTLTAGNTDLAKMAAGAGCINCETVDNTEDFLTVTQRLLDDGELGFLVVKIRPGKLKWPRGDRRPTSGAEDKFNFIRYVEELEGIVIHRGAHDEHD